MDGTIAQARKTGPKVSENEYRGHKEANDINI